MLPKVLERAAKIRVSPPTRPKNINAIKIRWEMQPKCGVTPRDRPTVPMADAVSNKLVRTGRPSSRLMASPPHKNRTRYIIMIVAA